MGSSTFGLGLCYNTHTVLLRLLKEDPNETLFKILLASFIFPLPISFFISKKAENIDNTIKDIKVSYVQMQRIIFMKCGNNMFGIVKEMQKNCKNYNHYKDN